MYLETIEHFALLAQKKSKLLNDSPWAYLTGSLMAGGYIGLGIILIFSVAGQLPTEVQKIIMGLTFGIALTLVVIAGSELFTGNTMYMTFGWLQGKTGASELLRVWGYSWLGNVVGSIVLALLFTLGGGGELFGSGSVLLQKVASYKINSPALELFTRGILCNWLVCLALWMSARVSSDSGKCIVIFWCAFAFIASGFEHSIANVSVLSLALLAEHGADISVNGMIHNIFWVTLGNIIGGAGFMGLGYWYATSASLIKRKEKKRKEKKSS